MSISLVSSAPISAIPRSIPVLLPTTHSYQNHPSYSTRQVRCLDSAIVQSRTFTRRTQPCCCLTMPVEETATSTSQDSLLYSRAYWVSRSVIALDVDPVGDSCYLYASRSSALYVTQDGIQGHDVIIELERDEDELPETVTEKFPHIRGYIAFKVPPLDSQSLLKCQLAVAIFNGNGDCISATGVQLPGVLDDIYSYNGPLGAVFSNEAVLLYLWAPTAQEVHAYIYQEPSGGDPLEIVQLKELNGIWSVNGPKNWEGCYYVYEVSVYHPSTLRVERCIANDPYARGLSGDGKRTLLVNLDSDALKPPGWDNLADEKPGILSFSDISIYELHIRDFSANDSMVDPDFRGGYLAFTSQEARKSSNKGFKAMKNQSKTMVLRHIIIKKSTLKWELIY